MARKRNLAKPAEKTVDYGLFYRKLYAPLERKIGPIDPMTIFAIMGFDGGGPLNFSTIGAEKGEPFITYVSCELVFHKDQKPSKFGRYELLCTCDDENWVRGIVSDVGRESLESTFGHNHTLDIGAWVKKRASIQGILLEKVCSTKIDDKPFGIMRVIGLTRREMEYRLENGVEALKKHLKAVGVYPKTQVKRASVV